MCKFDVPERADPLAARELVDLGGGDRRVAHSLVQPPPCRDVAVETRMARVHEEQRASMGGTGRKGWMGGRGIAFLPILSIPPVLPIPTVLPIPPVLPKVGAGHFVERLG